MTDSRFFRLLGISLVAALWLSLGPQAAAQVTVNAPQGLLGGKDKKETKAKPDKDSKDKSQQSKDKNSDPGIVAPGEGETQLGDGQAQSPAEPRHDTHAVKPAGRGKVKITGAMKESFHYYDQAITKQVTGYRIQVLFSSRRGARNLAYARAKELAMAFPQYHYYVSYNAPQWRLHTPRVGPQGPQAHQEGLPQVCLRDHHCDRHRQCVGRRCRPRIFLIVENEQHSIQSLQLRHATHR